jgi:lysophospholipase L1-like esterase
MKFQKWMPDAIITIETPLSGRGNSTNNSRPDRFETVEFQKSEKVREAAKRFSCPVIDVNAECGINAVNGGNYMADGVHPNNEGEDMIVRVETAKMRAIYPKI